MSQGNTQLESAVVILRSPEGMVFQHRANVPGIADPDMLSLFGGLVETESGESPREALEREIIEETNGTLVPTSMGITQLWTPKTRPVFIGGRPRMIRVNVFHGRIPRGAFEINHESQGIGIFEPDVFVNGNRPERMTRFAFWVTKQFLKEGSH